MIHRSSQDLPNAQELPIIVNGPNSKWIDYIGVSSYLVEPKELLIVSDQKKKQRMLYVSHRSWVDLLYGTITFPIPRHKNAVVCEGAHKHLLKNQLPARTKKITLQTVMKKCITVSIDWETANLRSIYNHFGM